MSRDTDVINPPANLSATRFSTKTIDAIVFSSITPPALLSGGIPYEPPAMHSGEDSDGRYIFE